MRTFFLSVIAMLPLVACGPAKPDAEMNGLIDGAMEFSAKQAMLMYDAMQEYPDRLPKSIKNGELETSNAHWWTSGFYPGVYWYLYEYFRTPELLSAAEAMSERVRSQQYTTDNHDVGFIMNCSFGNGYRLTGKEDYRDVIINGAKSLSTRFSPVVGCIRSWDHVKTGYAVIIDNMMNLELLEVVAGLTGDASFDEIARKHSDTTIENHFRDDYSSFHVIEYDENTGEILKKRTHQGLNDASAWSRGQAWGLYGYTMMYRFTKERKYLDQAIKIAEFVINHPNMPEDGVPYWDFDSPEIPDTVRDASAASIIASALIELSTFTKGAQSGKYLGMAEKQIKSLASDRYTAGLGENCNFILMHSTGYYLAGSEVDAPLTYADYYYIEALIRYKRLLEGKPVA